MYNLKLSSLNSKPIPINSLCINTTKMNGNNNIPVSSSKENYSTHFRILLNAHYYLGICPFKVQFIFRGNRGARELKFTSNKLQKICSYLVTLLIVLLYIYFVYTRRQKSTREFFPNWIENFNLDLNQGGSILFICILWFKQKDLYEFLQSITYYSCRQATFKAVVCLIVCEIIALTANFLVVIKKYEEIWWDLNQRRKFFSGVFIGSMDRLIMNDATIIIYALGELYLQLVCSSIDNIILFTAIVLRSSAIQLDRKINDPQSTFQSVLDEYDKIKEATKKANQAFGKLILLNCTCIIFYYAESVHNWLLPGNTIDKLSVIPFIVVNIVAYGFAANFYQRVTFSMKSWIYSKRNELRMNADAAELMVILSDIHNNPVGLEGYFFTVSYGFIGSIMGLIITYGIIMYQIKPS